MGQPSETEIAGMAATGRMLLGPASDLVELSDDRGYRHTAIVFHPEYRGHNAINDALRVVQGFLESPMVTGLCELVAQDEANGAFVYPTGEGWSVAEVIRTMADLGEPAGIRAGLELMYAAGYILMEAAENGASEGVYSHGGLTPWRILVKKDGQIQIIGHALPQVEILQFHEDERQVPREDSFRYCPPERMEAQAEDLSSDLFGLALIAFELMTGKPVYDGLVNDIRQQAARGEGSRRLFRFREILPEGVRGVLTQAVRPAPADRFESGEDFLYAVQGVLSSAEATGPSLMDVMTRVTSTGQRTGKQLDAGKTTLFSKAEIQQMLEEDEAAEAAAAGGGRTSKAWSPPPARGPRSVDRSTSAPRDAGAGGDDADKASAAPSETSAPDRSSPRAVPRTSAPRRVRRDRAPVDSPAHVEPGITGEAPAASAESLKSSGRWSKVTRSAARRAPPRSAPEAEEDLSGPESAPRGATSSQSARRVRRAPRSASGGRPSAEDLLRKLKESGSNGVGAAPSVGADAAKGEGEGKLADPRWSKAREEERASAQAVLQRILRSGDKSEGAGEGEATTPGEGASGSKPPVPVGTGPAPELPPEGAAQARAEAPPAEAEDPDRTDAPASQREAPAPARSTSAPPRRRRKTPPEPTEDSPTEERAALAGARRSPDPIPGGASLPSELRAYKLVLDEEGKGNKVRLPTTTSVAAAVGRLVGTLVPAPVDGLGTLTGWYRLDGPDGPLSARSTLADVPAKAELRLRFVPAGPVSVDLVVAAPDGEQRLRTVLGRAVPLASVVDHLCRWLELPAGPWQLEQDGDSLGPHLVLHDLEPGEGGRLELHLVPAKRRRGRRR